MWTIERVKEELPDVRIKIEGRIYPGSLRGRKEKFATVFVCPGEYYSFAWETIVRALNNETFLKV